MEAVGIGSGILLGILSGLVPGFHLATIFTILLGLRVANLIPAEALALAVTAGAGTVVFTRLLSHIYHPTAQDQLDYADPAVRLAYDGLGNYALEALIRATKHGAWFAVPATAVILFVSFLGFQIGKTPGFVAIIAIVVWVLMTMRNAKKTWVTLAAILAAGLYGYIAMHHPASRGSEHALAPLLAGLFAIPSGYFLFAEAKSKPAKFPKQMPFYPEDLDLDEDLAPRGQVLGAITGFLAGLGAGSLVSTMQDDIETDLDYAFFQTVADATNDLLAIGLVLTIGLGRSGEAAILKQVLPEMNLAMILACILAMMSGLWFGHTIVKLIAKHYAKLSTKIDPRIIAALTLATGLASSWIASQWIGLAIATAGCLIAVALRTLKVPAQVSLAALAFPVLIYSMGLVPALNSVLF